MQGFLFGAEGFYDAAADLVEPCEVSEDRAAPPTRADRGSAVIEAHRIYPAVWGQVAIDLTNIKVHSLRRAQKRGSLSKELPPRVAVQASFIG
jgi:hypothetical protein